MTIAQTYQCIGILIGIGCSQSSLENLVLAIKHPSTVQFKLKNSSLIRSHYNCLSFGFDTPGIWLIYSLKFILAVVILFESLNGFLYWYLPLVYIFIEFLGYQRQYFLTNSDIPIQRVVLVGMAIHFYCADIFISEITLYFISLQLCLAYFAAGWQKLNSSAWQDASALQLIFKPHLPPKIQPYFEGSKNIKWLAWSVIIWETSFLLSLGGGFINQAYLIIGIVFHGFNSLVGGINFFLWSFVACYPAIYFVGNQVHNYLF